MACNSEFVDYLLELMAAVGAISARRMFGGYGLYRDGVFFGLVADDTLYLKADDLTRGRFEAQGLTPFAFDAPSRGRTISSSYYRCPDEALESAALMQEWVALACAAALRTAAEKRVPRPRRSRARAGPEN